MARGEQRLGIIRRRTGAQSDRYRIDFGRRWGPRFLNSFRGVRFETEEMARAILSHVEMEFSRGRPLDDILSELAPIHSTDAAIERLVERWLAHFRRQVHAGDRQPRTLREYDRWARSDNHFSWWYGRSLFEIDEVAVEDWSLWLAERDLSRKTRRNVMAGFHTFCTWASKQRRLFRVPDFTWPEPEEHIPTVLTLEVQLHVLEAIPEPKRGIFLCLATTGTRPSEARVLRVRSWDADNLRVEEGAKDRLVDGLVRGPKRQRAKRTVPAIPLLRDWLERHVPKRRRLGDPDGWLFQNPDGYTAGRQWSETALRRTWGAARDRVGVKVGLYEGTKHTLATLLKQAGYDDRTIAEVLGHADVRSVEAYARVQNATIRRALLRLHRGDE